jgi:hypothetical protein
MDRILFHPELTAPRDAQAAKEAAGGGRVNRANVDSALALAGTGKTSMRVITAATDAGAGLRSRCTARCAATHNEQSA